MGKGKGTGGHFTREFLVVTRVVLRDSVHFEKPLQRTSVRVAYEQTLLQEFRPMSRGVAQLKVLHLSELPGVDPNHYASFEPVHYVAKSLSKAVGLAQGTTAACGVDTSPPLMKGSDLERRVNCPGCRAALMKVKRGLCDLGVFRRFIKEVIKEAEEFSNGPEAKQTLLELENIERLHTRFLERVQIPYLQALIYRKVKQRRFDELAEQIGLSSGRVREHFHRGWSAFWDAVREHQRRGAERGAGFPPDSIEELFIESQASVRLENCLQNAGITTIKQLLSWTESDLLKVKNFGAGSLRELRGILSGHNLQMRM